MSPGDHRPLRIAMVLDSWDDTNNGAVVSTRRFAELLRDRGHQVTVLAAGGPEPGKVALRQFRVPLVDGIMRTMRFRFAWPDRRILEETLSRQDVVHVQFPFYLGIRAVTLARRAGVPLVSTFHVQAEHLLHNVGIRNRAMVAQVYRFFLSTVYDRSDHVVCPSAFAERELRRHGLRAPVTVISNGLPPQYRPTPRSQWPDFGGKFAILSVGRLAREKRHDLLVEAIRRSRHEGRIQLVVIGDGPLRRKLEAQARTLTNAPRFLYLPPPELIPYYGAADLDVHAAEVEVECMSVLEAMGCGAPCLIARSPLSATSQFAISDRFLFQSGSRDELTAKIDWFFEHPEALREARTRSRQVAESYRIEDSLEKLLGVYAEVTGGAAPRDRRRPLPPGEPRRRPWRGDVGRRREAEWRWSRVRRVGAALAGEGVAPMWYETPVRLSRGRVLLRAALLWAGGGWALWWAWRSHGRARGLELQGAERALHDRLALVYALVGALAVLTGLVAALAARRRVRRHTLRLGEPSAGAGAPPSTGRTP